MFKKLAIGLIGLLSIFNPISGYEANLHIEHQFSKFLVNYNKVYETHQEYQHRLAVFADNYKFIEEHNSKNTSDGSRPSYTLAINQFADLTSEEFKTRFTPMKVSSLKHLQQKPSNLVIPSNKLNISALPTALDWRTASQNPKNLVAVTAVKNQGQCGSCYGHAAAESTESAMAISGYPLVELSPQQIVDCSNVPPYNNAGCGGGDPTETFQYVIDHGLCKASDYPYTGVQGTCKKCTPVGHLNGYVNIPDESSMLVEIQKGPLNIAIEADSAAFQFYSSGVFDDPSCGTNLDHAVNLVGYGVDNSKPYFILRNSWGTGWGENGYMRIIRGKNECGLAQYAQRGYYLNQLNNVDFNWDLLYECVGECGLDIIKDVIQCAGDLAHIWDILKCVGSIVGTVSPCYKCVQGILG